MSRIFDAVKSVERVRATWPAPASPAPAPGAEVDAPAPSAVSLAPTAEVEPHVEVSVETTVETSVEAPVEAAVAKNLGLAVASVVASAIALRTDATLDSAPSAVGSSGTKFGVVGVTWEDVAGSARIPYRRLANELRKQLTRVNFRHTDMTQALVYGDGGVDAETLRVLRRKYRHLGRFCEFAYFNQASRAACEQFGIELRIFDLIDREALPDRSIVLIHEPYFPGV